VGLLVKPEDIQIMKKERVCNTFEGEILKGNKVSFLGADWDIPEDVASQYNVGDEVQVTVDFDKVDLQDYEDEGTLTGEVYFILFKGNHNHLTIRTDEGDDIFVNTHDAWDDGDRVGIAIHPEDIHIAPLKK